jgi:hypothetical protein
LARVAHLLNGGPTAGGETGETGKHGDEAQHGGRGH